MQIHKSFTCDSVVEARTIGHGGKRRERRVEGLRDATRPKLEIITCAYVRRKCSGKCTSRTTSRLRRDMYGHSNSSRRLTVILSLEYLGSMVYAGRESNIRSLGVSGSTATYVLVKQDRQAAGFTPQRSIQRNSRLDRIKEEKNLTSPAVFSLSLFFRIVPMIPIIILIV